MTSELAGVRHEARVRGVDAAHVGEDLAAVGAEGRGERDGGRVRAAAAERRRLARAAVLVASRAAGPGTRRRSRRCRCRAPLRTRRGSTLAMRARPCDASVVMPACAPVSEIALHAEGVEGHRDERGALVLAGREEHVQLAGIGVVGDRCGELERARRSCRPSPRRRPRGRAPVARARAIRCATRRIRAASPSDEPPNFCTTSWLGVLAGIGRGSYRTAFGDRRPGSDRRLRDTRSTARPAVERCNEPFRADP